MLPQLVGNFEKNGPKVAGRGKVAELGPANALLCISSFRPTTDTIFLNADERPEAPSELGKPEMAHLDRLIHPTADRSPALPAGLSLSSGRAYPANSNLPDARGRTPLHHAALEPGRICMVLVLVEELGADPWPHDFEGKTPLDKALEAGQECAAVYLSQGMPLACYTQGAAASPASTAALELVRPLLREGKVDELVAVVRSGSVAPQLLPEAGPDMTTPLHCSVEARLAEACRRLVLEAGLDVDAPNGKSQTPLLLAARQEEGVDALVRALVGVGVDPLRKNKRGRDVLSLCVRKQEEARRKREEEARRQLLQQKERRRAAATHRELQRKREEEAAAAKAKQAEKNKAKRER